MRSFYDEKDANLCGLREGSIAMTPHREAALARLKEQHAREMVKSMEVALMNKLGPGAGPQG